MPMVRVAGVLRDAATVFRLLFECMFSAGCRWGLGDEAAVLR